MPANQRARGHLYDSVMGGLLGDFSHYIIRHLDEWSSDRINEPHKLTHRELHDQFVESLTDRQKAAWDIYCTVRNNIVLYRRLERDQRKEIFKREFTEAEFVGEIHSTEHNFLKTLRKNSKKYNLFRDVLADYITEPDKYYREDSFDGQFARRWIMAKIIEMGWTDKRFGEFDWNVNRYSPHGREADKPERIGKKYQWIAFHELLARLADNFKMREDKWSGRSAEYRGPWDLGYRRDIDPSNLLQRTQRDEWRPHANTWWFPTHFVSWEKPVDEVEWLKVGNNLPCIQDIIEVIHPDDGSHWYTLNGFYSWEQPTPIGEERYELKRRDLWYMLKCYLVKKVDAAKLLAWGNKQSWMGRWMPESQVLYNIFLGEFFWSPAFKDQDYYHYGLKGGTYDSGDKIPCDILLANDEYGRESGSFDCSIDDTIFIDLPCRILVEELNLDWRGTEGSWYDRNGNLVSFDPSVRYKGPRVLLFHRDSLLDFINQHELTLFWTLLGEKRTIGGPMLQKDHKGYLEINGAYILKDNVVTGGMHSQYITPGAKQ